MDRHIPGSQAFGSRSYTPQKQPRNTTYPPPPGRTRGYYILHQNHSTYQAKPTDGIARFNGAIGHHRQHNTAPVATTTDTPLHRSRI